MEQLVEEAQAEYDAKPCKDKPKYIPSKFYS